MIQNINKNLFRLSSATTLLLTITFPGISYADATCNASSCDLIAVYLQPTLDLLSGIVGIIVVISLILGGVQYSASEGDPQKSAKAKDRIAKTIFALLAYFFLYAFLQFIIPNGAFH